MSKFLVTGGAGFIGGNFLHIMVNKYPNDEFVCIDALTYAGNMETLEPIMNKKNFKFVHGDISSLSDNDGYRKFIDSYGVDPIVSLFE